MKRIVQFVIRDLLRNKIILAYTVLMALLSWGVFSLEDNSSKGVLTLLNLILLNVPLVAIVFSCTYLYNSSEFIELLLSQPLKRVKIWSSIYIGIQITLISGFILGAGIPIFIYAPFKIACILVLVGALLTAVFVSMAFLASIQTRDKAKGIGISILLWLFFALLFDGLVLFLLFQFAEYPIEHAMLFVSALSPIDLSRILVLLQLDVSAMMGYTGAIFREFFGTFYGMLFTCVVLLLWVFLPYYFSLRKFRTKDL